MKRIIALLLCTGIIFAFTGCKKKSPEEIEQQISKELSDAQYMDAHVSGSISMNIPDAGIQKITVDTDYKADLTGSFPKIFLDGSIGLESVMSFPISFYMDESSAGISILGQSEAFPFSDEDKAQIQMLLGENAVQTNFNKTVTQTTYNNQNALLLNFDLAAMNQLLNSSSTGGTDSIDSLMVYYLLSANNELDAIAANIVLTSDGEQMTIDLTIKFNSIGEPVEITPITGSTDATYGTDRTLDLLTNMTQNAA